MSLSLICAAAVLVAWWARAPLRTATTAPITQTVRSVESGVSTALPANDFDQLQVLKTLPCFADGSNYVALIQHLEQQRSLRVAEGYPDGLIRRGPLHLRPDDLLLLPDEQNRDGSGASGKPAVDLSPPPNDTPAPANQYPLATPDDRLLAPVEAPPAVSPRQPPKEPREQPPKQPSSQASPAPPSRLAPMGPSLLRPEPPRPAPRPASPNEPHAQETPPRSPPAHLPGAPHGPLRHAPRMSSQGNDPHREVFRQGPFPSALACRQCHAKIYEEWSMSSHAYAAVSPMFQKFEQKISELTHGTLGYFCMRCHAPVATTLKYPRHASAYDGVPSANEGVTCVACHRVVEPYGRANGERRMEPGDIHAPVVAAGPGHTLREVLANAEKYRVQPQRGAKGPGEPIHAASIQFESLSSSHFCVSCHQVAVFPGIKLEVVWEQYRDSPARRQGVTCQDCHMGKTPGRADGYECAPAAMLAGNKHPLPRRKHSNHVFFGPGYSIAHPGLFPKHPKASRWSHDQWLMFDWRAGWGTEGFEEALAAGRIQCSFSEPWGEADDRYDAREIIDANLQLLSRKHELRRRLMENGSKVEGPFFTKPRRAGRGLTFHYVVTNLNGGHNMPSGSLGAQPQLWLNVALTGPRGQHLWESGYLDRNGDLADLHSLEVAAGRVAHDRQLFNLQTKFLTTNVKGTDREMYLPLNFDVDPLPFIRPSGFPITTMNHPPLIRMEAHSLPPYGSRRAAYRVPAELIRQPGRYRLSVRMRSRAEPIYFMKFCESTPEMIRTMNERMLDFHAYAVEFDVPP